MRARLRMIVLAVAITLITGCGAKPGQPRTASTWASAYCSALNDWVTTLDSISRGFVEEPIESTTLNITDLETVSREVSQAGSTLTDALSRAGRPETTSAATVEATIAKLSTAIKTRSAAARRAAKSNDRSALAGFRRLQAMTEAINGSLSDILSADSSIRKEDAALARALDGSSACRDFHSDVTKGTRRGNR